MSTNKRKRGLDALVKLQEAAGTVTEHQDKLDGARSEIAAIRTRLDQIEANIDNIEASVNTNTDELVPVLEAALADLTTTGPQS